MKYDDELLQIFIEEAKDILESINAQLESWRESLSQIALLPAILRELHTLKGSARMIGLIPISEYVHTLEQLIQKIHSGDIAPQEEIQKEIQQAIDYLNYYVDALAKSVPIDPIPAAQLERCLGFANLPMTDESEVKIGSNTKTFQEPAFSDVIRIKTEVLDKFSHLAGQVNVSRAHLVQKLGKARDVVSEMAKEIKLVQEQIRYLQVKADLNVRPQATHLNEKYDDFDALELDRYSFWQQSTRSLLDKINYLEQLNIAVTNVTRGFDGLLIEQGRAARSLEENITHARMISLSSLVPRLSRIVRQVSKELGKEVKFECIKAQGEIDRRILERLITGLEHMIRNAIDHGIESSDERIKVGKPPIGVITLSVFRQGNEMIIELGDDGQGIDIEKVKEKALEKKLWHERIMSDKDAMQMILLPGFSTKESVTPISGRGLGMDVVNNEINKLGGKLEVSTNKQEGTKFTIHLPFGLSLSQTLILRVNEQIYSIPLANLTGITRLSLNEINETLNAKVACINYAHHRYNLFYLGQFLGANQWQVKDTQHSALPVILLKSKRSNIAFVIDKLIASRETVIKPSPLQLQFLKEIAGASLLSEGQIVLVLNTQYLIEQASDKIEKQEDIPEKPVVRKKQQKWLKVLVVDDSAVVRQVTSRLLKRHFFVPMTAFDGVDAFEVMAKTLPDIMLLDIEMPRMDGFAVVEQMKKDSRYKNIPVIMITSRSGKKHQLRAMKAGVDGYLTKPYFEDELLKMLQKYSRQLVDDES
ncbi:MAG: response regulator [Proteobacteria bacterium]|nr:response regulator [Pseudomonadota bacterium]